MRKTTTLLLLVMLAIAALIARPQSKGAISGRVLNASDQPIEGVKVQAYRQSILIGKPSISNPNGEYTISFDAGPPVDTVRYDHPDWFPGTVDHISGSNDQKVFKTLYKRGTALSYFEAQEVISALDRIQELDRRNQVIWQRLDEYRYPGALEQVEAIIDKLDAPADVRSELKQQITAIKKRSAITLNRLPAEWPR